jgi:hypothetical protein
MPNELVHQAAQLGVPHVAVIIIITGKKKLSGERKAHRRNTAQNLIIGVFVQLIVGTDVEQPARGVVRPSSKRSSVGKKTVRS